MFRLHAEGVSKALMNIPPGFLVVAAVGSRFLELDHSEPREFFSRLYYLTDQEAEIRYTQSNIFKDFGMIRQVYPVRASVEPYSQFAANHEHFLILLFLATILSPGSFRS